MQFTAAILALAASASAVALPRSTMGSWEVSLSQLDTTGSFFTTAVFTSDAYPEGLRSSCVITAEEPIFNRCDRASFTADWDGKTLKLSQGLEKPDPQTVFGEAEFTLVADEYHQQHRAEGTVEVTKAIA